MAAAVPAAQSPTPTDPAAAPGATPGFTQNATAGIDQAQMAALAQLAAVGKTTNAGFGIAAQNDQAARVAALKQAMAFNTAANTPTGTVAQETGNVTAVPDARSVALGQERNNFASANALNQADFNNYFNLTKAGLPVAQAELGRTIANDQVTAAQRAMSQQLTTLRDQLALAKLQAGPTTAQVLSGLGGAANAGQTLIDQANAINQGSPAGAANGGYTAADRALAAGRTITTPAEEGRGAGLPGAVAQTITDRAAQAAAAAQATQSAKDQVAKQAADYNTYFPAVYNRLTGSNGAPKQTAAQIVAVLQQQGVDAVTINKLLTDAAARAKIK